MLVATLALAAWQSTPWAAATWLGHAIGAGAAGCAAAVVWFLARRWPAPLGVVFAALAAAVMAPLGHAWMVAYRVPPGVDLLRHTAWVLMWLAMAALWEAWQRQRLLPALVNARLQALHARMQPHFLFNSLNSVLALIRRDPERAETLLEDLAELYRALLKEPRHQVTLAEELALARSYLAVEQARLGERLAVQWRVDVAPMDALLPSLTLQPLVENAVVHGVEPRLRGGCVTVEVFVDTTQLVLFVRNPIVDADRPVAQGHGIALNNLRERLALHHGASARLRVYESDGEFVAQVSVPLKRKAATEPSTLNDAPRRSAS